MLQRGALARRGAGARAGKRPGERDEVPRQLWVDTMVIDPGSCPTRGSGARSSSGPSGGITEGAGSGGAGRPRHRVARSGRRSAGAGQGVRDAEERADIPREATSYGEKFLVQPDPGTARWSMSGSGLGSRRSRLWRERSSRWCGQGRVGQVGRGCCLPKSVESRALGCVATSKARPALTEASEGA